ncbi:MAG: uracil-DNA glycosylase [Limnohabitans sp.]
MSDPTRFDLDDRQRAMLAEMGVRVWWPQSPAPTEAAPDVQTAPVAAVASAAPVVQASAMAGVPGVVTHAAPVAVARPAPSVAPTPAARQAAATPVPAVPMKPLADGLDRMDWAALQATATACQACDLCQQRQNVVFGAGDVQASWMVIGEAPDEDEDKLGEPFVGQAGQLLDNMLKAVGLNRQVQGEGGVYITPAVKCRPPGSRNPTAQELAICAPYLARQVALVQPKIIMAMGRFAVQALLQTTEPLGKLRGQLHTFQGVPVVVTYHPAYLLRNPADKAKAWVDLVLALKTAQG